MGKIGQDLGVGRCACDHVVSLVPCGATKCYAVVWRAVM